MHKVGSGYIVRENRILNWISLLTWNGLQSCGIIGDLKLTYRKW